MTERGVTDPTTTGRAGRPRVVRDDPAGRAAAIEVLRAGGIVVLPTDTVYGIAVALATPGGIERLFHVKQRPPEKAIALLLADADQAGELGLVSPAAAALAAALWPGPLTLVLPARPVVVGSVTVRSVAARSSPPADVREAPQRHPRTSSRQTALPGACRGPGGR